MGELCRGKDVFGREVEIEGMSRGEVIVLKYGGG